MLRHSSYFSVVRLLKPEASGGALTVGLPSTWVDISEEIAANMQLVRTKIAELAKAQAKALMPSFGDGTEDQRRIEALTQEITNLLKKSEKRLQRLSATGPSEDLNVRKNVQVRLYGHYIAYCVVITHQCMPGAPLPAGGGVFAIYVMVAGIHFCFPFFTSW
ncbi:unnamed protein product [Ilex paraguariensis]|uniref:Syntaxin N-terminal domain-containing protein n=1 Tax=Ilex paraguariensis TaxID=185542 RepID=A0ABC8UY18_9AQUA